MFRVQIKLFYFAKELILLKVCVVDKTNLIFMLFPFYLLFYKNKIKTFSTRRQFNYKDNRCYFRIFLNKTNSFKTHLFLLYEVCFKTFMTVPKYSNMRNLFTIKTRYCRFVVICNICHFRIHHDPIRCQKSIWPSVNNPFKLLTEI